MEKRWVQVGGEWRTAEAVGLTAEEWEALRDNGEALTAFLPCSPEEELFACIDYVDEAAALASLRTPLARGAGKLRAYRRGMTSCRGMGTS